MIADLERLHILTASHLCIRSAGRRRLSQSQRARCTLTPLALIEPIILGGIEAGTTTAATSDKGVTTNAEAASTFSEDARTMVSAERWCRVA